MSVKGKNNKEFPKLDFGYLVQFQDGEFGEVSVGARLNDHTGERTFEPLVITKDPLNKINMISIQKSTLDENFCFRYGSDTLKIVKVYDTPCKACKEGYKPFSTDGRKLLWEREDESKDESKKDINEQLDRCETLSELKKLLVKHGVEDYGLSEKEATAIYDLAEAMAKLTVDSLFSE